MNSCVLALKEKRNEKRSGTKEKRAETEEGRLVPKLTLKQQNVDFVRRLRLSGQALF
jgi:hypothetical protein